MSSWREALDVFEAFNNRPVYLGRTWWGGDSWPVVQPAKYVARCREKLGLPALADRREFQPGKPVCCLHRPQFWARDRQWVVAADATGLWIGAEDQLLHLDFDLHTNLSFSLPPEGDAAITSLYPSPTNLWIGTAGAGLIEFDPSTKKCRRYTEADGLLMNSVGALTLCGDKLWIGYQQESGGGGGLAHLDLQTRKTTSYSGSVTTRSEISPTFPFGSEKGDTPTRQRVSAIVPVAGGDVWFVTPTAMRPTVRRFRPKENVWEGTAEVSHCNAIAATETKLFAGEYQGLPSVTRGGLPKPPPDPSLGVRARALDTGQWHSLPAPTNLPPSQVTALLVNGDDLWVGGVGFIARYDSRDETLRAFCYIPAEYVHRLQVGGGYLWAQFDRHLYRVPLVSISKGDPTQR